MRENEKEERTIEYREVNYLERPAILESIQREAQQRKSGSDLRNDVQQAIANDERFLAQKQAEESQKPKSKRRLWQSLQ